MGISKISRADFIPNIKEDVVTIAANLRLASLLNKEAATGLKTWATYPVYTLEQFVSSSLEQAIFTGDYPIDKYPSKILEPLAQQLIWENIICRSEQDSPLSNFTEIARYAKEAWQHLRHWDLQLSDIPSSFEFNKLKRWIIEYQKLNTEQDAADPLDLFKDLSLFNQQHKIIHEPHIQFAGFEKPNPLLQKFINSLENNGAKVTWLASPDIAKTIFRTEQTNLKSEIDTMANWCQTILAKDPDCKIAIIVPELKKHRETIAQSLTQHLYPDQYGLENISSEDLYNISLGDSLLDHNLVGSALGLLEILTCSHPIDYSLFSTILNSRNFQPESTSDKAQFDCYFRQQTKPQTTLDEISCLIQTQYQSAPPEWAIAWLELNQLKNENSSKKSYSQWAETFSTYLNLAGFASNKDKSFLEHQVLTSFQKAFLSFSNLQVNQKPIHASAAFSLFKRVCADRIFQAETSHTVNIEVMGILESADQVFDHLWFVGANANTLPNAAKPNPLLPLALQKELKMPFASARQELKRAQNLIKRLQTNAQNIIFSSAKVLDAKETLASRLIASFPIHKTLFATDINIKLENLESLADYSGNKKPEGKLKSAVRFIQDQATCPLMAYAIHRLGARHPETPNGVLSPMVRGQIIHHVLENIYGRFDQQKSLENLLPEDLKKIIFHTMKQQENQSGVLGKNTFSLELERIWLAVNHWLVLDKARENFWVIARELPVHLTLNGFEFNLRIDRVDKLEDNTFAIIDYKTGLTSKVGWFNERLTEPQLPLYAISQNKITTIVFAEIKPTGAKLKYSGINEIIKARDSLLDKQEWQKQLDKWQAQLESLTQEIKKGLAVLSLENSASVIDSDASGFCRAHEQQ